MRRFSSKRQLSVLSELNITPLLDLALVLLTIFIITTPLGEQNLELLTSSLLTTPTSSGFKTSVPLGQAHTINVHQDSSLTFNGKSVTIRELETQLHSLHTRDPHMAIVIRAHEALSIQRLVHIIDCLSRIGISKVGVATRQAQSHTEYHPYPPLKFWCFLDTHILTITSAVSRRTFAS